MIWFATIQLGEVVHAQALGFTHTLYEFVHAETEADAMLAARLHYERGAATYGKPVKVKRVRAGSAAVHQDINRYAFPEQHIRAEVEFKLAAATQHEEAALAKALERAQ